MAPPRPGQALPPRNQLPGPSPLLTKSEYAYETLRAQILTGELEPGAIVSSETLAANLGLSATPVREAMRRLASEDLLVLAAHRDVRVKPLTRAELEGLWEAKRILDEATLESACTNAKDDELSEPADILRAQADAPDQQLSLFANREFHRSMYARCGNDVLIQLLDSLWDRTDRYRLILEEPNEDRDMVDEEHVELADAFARRDAKELLRLYAVHTSGALDRLLSRLDA